MAIYSLKIQNFKSIKATDDIRIMPLNILIGSNGSGKSNFISFFKLIQAIGEGRLQHFIDNDINALLYFGRKKSPFISGNIVFKNNETNDKNALDFVIKPREKSEKGTLQVLSERYYKANAQTWKETIIDQNVEESTWGDGLNNDFLKYINAFKIYHFHDTSLTSPLRDACAIHNNRSLAADGSNLPAYLYYLQVKQPKVFKKIEGIVRFVAPFFERFDLAPNRLNDKIELRWREKGADADDYFNARYLSDGTLRFIALATLLLQEDLPPTIIIDEPELGLHPSAISHLAEMLKTASQKCQVIVATQSTDLVNHFEAQDIIAVDRQNRTEGTIFKRFTKEELAVWLDDEVYGMGDLWEKNLIGARP